MPVAHPTVSHSLSLMSAAISALFFVGCNLEESTDSNSSSGNTSTEGPSNISVLTQYAGAYSVTGQGTGGPSYCTPCGEATRNHSRNTIEISSAGAIDFDTGISFSVGDINAIYNRDYVDHDRRIAVNYGASDSDERVRLYLNASKEVMEIIHDDGDGERTRALVTKD